MSDRKAPPALDNIAFLCGLFAGVLQSAVFNPYDRALYLSVVNRTNFLSWENWQAPYRGFLQTVGGRALSGGLYFPLEHFFMTMVPENSGASGNFFAGTLAGCGNALLLNPISAVKYKTWGRDVNRGMLNEIVSMFRQGGLRPFLNGLQPTILRDVTFGGVYTYLRLELQWAGVPPDYQWVSNMMAAGIAAVVSGPFNLARNEQYAVRSFQKAPTIAQVLVGFIKEVKEAPSIFQKCHHIQSRLRIGYGTLRVAIGMSFGHHVYDTAMLQYELHKAEFNILDERLTQITSRKEAVRRVEGDEGSGNPS